jgi:hypothetical protein
MSVQEMLEEAISLYGTGDIRTLKSSQQRDKEIVEQQKEIYKTYKEKSYVSTVCN